MAFDIIAARGYGSGEDGNATNPATVNHYAQVTASLKSDKKITITGSDTSAFTVGTEILLHISGLRSSSGNKTYLGRWKFAKIMAVDGNELTLSVKPFGLTVDYYFYQAITVPHYKTLTISSTIAPPAFDEAEGTGGVFVCKCSKKLVMSGAINLVDKGLQTADYRPLLNQESNGTLDTDKLSGYENYETVNNHLTLQKGDGACFIIAKQIDFESTARIGDPNSKGVHRCRGAEDSFGRASSYTNIGGSTIMLVAPTINDYSTAIISKYRSKTLEAGKGLARAYLATESTNLTFDEGLIAHDNISTPDRLRKETLFNGFGSGARGTARNADIQQNSYARVTKISTDGKTFTLGERDEGGEAQFERDALVMIHASYKNTTDHIGRFMLATVVGVTNSTAGKLSSITLSTSINDLGLSNFDTSHYDFQAIAIPQYKTYSRNNTKTPKYENGKGGIFAIAVSDTCNLTGKIIDVRGKGGSKYFAGVTNAQMKNRLPIGEGNGSVLILAKTLKVDTDTRLGGTHTGNSFGGGAYNIGNPIVDDGGYLGKRNQYHTLTKYDGYGGGGHQSAGKQFYGHDGGYFGNATNYFTSDTDNYSGCQGASLFIVAETIDGLCLDCLSTGGQGSYLRSASGGSPHAGNSGGCGYGGGGASNHTKFVYGGQGGVHGGGSGASNSTDSYYTGGGGSSGFCTIYANVVTNQDTTNLTFD